ncbi:MAG TPA: rhomboid family intramembrane serine protease [Planctomycetota bacterium]|nr:rhomboid family intramembrane serine protease [Planctomycetota bacterium]
MEDDARHEDEDAPRPETPRPRPKRILGTGRPRPTVPGSPAPEAKPLPEGPPARATLWLLVTIVVLFVVEKIVGSDSASLLRLGADEHGSVWEGGEYWRLITASFLHGGSFHIFMNATALLSIGVVFERLYGAARLLVVYFTSVIVASLVSTSAAGRLSLLALILPDLGSTSVSVGASGGLFGLWLFLIVARFTHEPHVREVLSSRESLRSLVWAGVVNFGIGCCPIIDNAAHVGGALSGIGLALVMRRTGPPPVATRVAAGALVGLAALALAVMVLKGERAATIYRTTEALKKSVESRDAVACASELDRLASLAGPDLGRVIGRSVSRATTIVEAAAIATRAPAALAAAQALEAHGLRAGLFLEVRARALMGDDAGLLAAATLYETGATVAERAALGSLLAQSKHADLGIPILEAVVAADARNVEARNSLAWTLLTCDDPKRRDPRRALDVALEAVNIGKPTIGQRDSMVLDTLAEAELQNGRLDDALEHEKKAIELGEKSFLTEWWSSVKDEYAARLARIEEAKRAAPRKE